MKGNLSPLPQELVHSVATAPAFSTEMFEKCIPDHMFIMFISAQDFLRRPLPEHVFEDCLEHTVLILKNHETAMDQQTSAFSRVLEFGR